MNLSEFRFFLSPIALAAFACVANAAEPSTGQDGMMKFPNARVEVATRPAAEVGGAPTPSGFTAFIDPTTGKLVQPTAEQAAALQAAGSGTAARKRAAGPARMIYPAQGGVGMTLDESQMSYFIAHRAADGKTDTFCLPDEKSAHEALRSSSKTTPVAKEAAR